MIKKISYNPALTAEENLQNWVIPINALIDAIGTGVVWENKVAADRAVDQVYNDLPISVVAEMIEEKVALAAAELGWESENENV